jgi:SAM-dependent methyltransferase
MHGTVSGLHAMKRGFYSQTYSLLRRYLQLYWLKPFDAVNDTANAWTLGQGDWQAPVLEIGSGDGVFSFVMHGGEFAMEDDRYDQADPSREGDIFDVYREAALNKKKKAGRQYAVGIDMKRSHVLKCRETAMYQNLLVSAPHPLPFADGVFKTVFLYFPHGLVERGESVHYEATLREIRRVLHSDGCLLMTAFNRKVADHFFCHRLAQFCDRRGWSGWAAYFARLDSGRYKEISGLGHSPGEWESILSRVGLEFRGGWTHLKPLAWLVYDSQTRPILARLIRWNWWLKRIGLKKWVKAACVHVTLPFLWLFFLIFCRPKEFHIDSKDRQDLAFIFAAVPARS